jgi:hypothetical protein
VSVIELRATPSVTYDRGIATVAWPRVPDLVMTFDLLRLERRGGEVSGEISVRALDLEGLDGHGQLHHSRLNLLAPRSRADIAAQLARRDPRYSNEDWAELVEQACTLTTRAFREGRPAFALREATEPPTGAGDVLPPLLSAAGPTIWFGDGGAGKSLLGLSAALALHTGEPLLGMTPTARLRTALLDFEWDAFEHKKRMCRLLGVDVRESGDALPDLLYVPCQSEGPLATQVDRLRRLFAQHRVQYAVLDSVGYACDGDPSEAEPALAFFRALARLEVGSLLVAHINRQGDTDKPFGSAFWHNSARSTWFLKQQSSSADSVVVGMFNRKANGRAKADPLGLQLRFEEARTVIERVQLRDVPELESEIPLRSRIRDALRSGPLAIHELASRLNANTDSVEKALRRGLGRTFVRLDGGGGVVTRWALQVADTEASA